ncbi:proteoglycan 4-like, partial [Centroberyx affinis]|uniref:proteoglycan 4-like n=1 Tax=Centroberyx affinis TaxID=166261 RepID=UPI003A5C6DD9
LFPTESWMNMMKMKMMMKITSWLLLLGLAVSFTAAAAPGSCVGRCGEVFTRGRQCTCDSNCMLHDECCDDFEAVCTNAQSCRGRCAELFRRGRLCECDPDCFRYNTCCHDYQLQCDASDVRASASPHRSYQSMRATATGKRKSEKSKKRSNSDSEEWPKGMSNFPFSLLPASGPSSPSWAPDSPASGSSLPSQSAPPLGSSGPLSPSGPGASGGKLNLQLVLSHGGTAPSGPSQGPRPSTLQDVAQALGIPLGEGGSEGPGTGPFANSDLCSDSPISGLTALSDGTILIFKGDLFWSVDPVSRSVGPPQSITDTLGVPSPIDTVFTRCNCQGHTYIIKGDQYWRLDSNMVVEPGFPQPLASGFSGLAGDISAALPLPATRSRPEMVYFFKKGDTMQKFSFPPGSAPSCSKKPRTSYGRRSARQAEVHLSGEINIKVSLKGLPSSVTSALSMPNAQRGEKYEYYVFSGPLFFTIKVSGDLPALVKPHLSAALTAPPSPGSAAMATDPARNADPADPANPAYPANSIMGWLQCP